MVARVAHHAEAARVRAVHATGRIADIRVLVGLLDEAIEAGEDHRRAWDRVLDLMEDELD